MTKVMFVMYRRADVSEDEFRTHWKDTHAPIAARMPGLKRYIQNYSVTIEGGEQLINGIAELHFDDMEALRNALSSPVGQSATTDLQTFCDKNRTTMIVVDEVTIV